MRDLVSQVTLFKRIGSPNPALDTSLAPMGLEIFESGNGWSSFESPALWTKRSLTQESRSLPPNRQKISPPNSFSFFF